MARALRHGMTDANILAILLSGAHYDYTDVYSLASTRARVTGQQQVIQFDRASGVYRTWASDVVPAGAEAVTS